MNKQEEIKQMMQCRIELGVSLGFTPAQVADEVWSFLHSQGVVIKVDRELPFVTSDFSLSAHGVYTKVSTKALSEQGYVATEPLVEE